MQGCVGILAADRSPPCLICTSPLLFHRPAVQVAKALGVQKAAEPAPELVATQGKKKK